MAKARRKTIIINKQKFIVESHLEEAFLEYWMQAHPDNPPVTQYHFSAESRYRLDFAWPQSKLGLEIQGYGPGHTSRSSMHRDANKHNLAVLTSWTLVYLTGKHLTTKVIHNSIKPIEHLLGLQNAHIQRRSRTYIPAAHRKRR